MTIIIPTAFQKYTDQNRQVDVEAGSVGQALRQLTDAYPELRGHLFGNDNTLVSFVGVFVNGRNIRDLESEATPLADTDEVLLVPAIAGG